MGRRVEPFRADDAMKLIIQPAQRAEQMIQREHFNTIERVGLAWSAYRGMFLYCAAGLIPQWPGRATVWALMAVGTDRFDMLFLTRQMRRFLNHVQQPGGYRRIEMTVDADFDAGHRWAETLGFSREGLMKCYDPAARDHVLYARIAP